MIKANSKKYMNNAVLSVFIHVWPVCSPKHLGDVCM